MKLHEDTKLFQQAARATAQYKKIPEIYIEKDYWVTYALNTIFTSEIGKETVFKGGTALSKCYGLIERFSEDIDLVVLQQGNESNNQLSNKIKKISKIVGEVMPEVQVEGITRKKGMNRKTAHGFPKIFKGDYGQVRKEVIVEATWLGYFEPYVTKSISSYIYEMMIAGGQHQMVDKYGLAPFELLVLEPSRTLCEKIMSLVRFSYGKHPINELKAKIRHTYDIHKLLIDLELLKFFNSSNLNKMLLKVAQDDVESYRNNNSWLANHPKNALIFSKTDEIWNQLSSTYNSTFKDMVFGELPAEQEIIETINMVRCKIESIVWAIDI